MANILKYGLGFSQRVTREADAICEASNLSGTETVVEVAARRHVEENRDVSHPAEQRKLEAQDRRRREHRRRAGMRD